MASAPEPNTRWRRTTTLLGFWRAVSDRLGRRVQPRRRPDKASPTVLVLRSRRSSPDGEQPRQPVRRERLGGFRRSAVEVRPPGHRSRRVTPGQEGGGPRIALQRSRRPRNLGRTSASCSRSMTTERPGGVHFEQSSGYASLASRRRACHALAARRRLPGTTFAQSRQVRIRILRAANASAGRPHPGRAPGRASPHRSTPSGKARRACRPSGAGRSRAIASVRRASA
jgi:hypothetical protein